MKQVIQDFKTGKLYLGEVPAPKIIPGYVLVRNRYSLISAGTERMTVSAARASLLGKARQRPDLVRMVIENLKKEGIAETLKKVKTKLSSSRELGYSSAGEVLISMDTNNYFKPGDRVACGGNYACHAELILVPQNLVARVPDSVDLDLAAFTTVGAIAMQGVRQADPKIGDLVCVIGLGLIGQITAQILKANGCQVFGIDISEKMIELGKELSCHRALTRSAPNLYSEIDAFTAGHGFDSVIITASAKTNDPLVLATQILRKKGIIVLVGAVPIVVPRDPDFYRKELELKMSCSYGPGRYDQQYEEGGKDYPYGYVRWTENRNMEAFLKLMETRKVNVRPLITHVFDIDKAAEAYDLITGERKEFYIGVLLSYGTEKDEWVKQSISVKHESTPEQEIRVGFIGAGSFAQKYLIPEVRTKSKLISVVTAHGITARNVADKFGFERCSSNVDDIFTDPKINTVFIATRHNTHAGYVIAAIKSGKHVFVEKPLALNYDQLEKIVEAYNNSNRILMVGFNRRFSHMAGEAYNIFSGISHPKIINYRINAGYIPPEHWIYSEEGGGRILGEVCHFVDFIQFVTNSIPRRVFAECIYSQNAKMPAHDNLIITIHLMDGSVGVISYTSCGSSKLEKERIEIHGGGNSFIINDFREAVIYRTNRVKKLKKPGKGHKEEIEQFMSSIENGLPSPISFESIYYTTLATLKIVDSLRTGIPLEVKSE
ncbi:MAG: bi-domain-containing oxidoreductase [Tepidanaerobacteraceae bacterium]|jgi:polar amino acid transport system substrate-binding protein|nr:bi-domain-containing oxidoreductase [Tepidanaerobacteraceae bacterium]